MDVSVKRIERFDFNSECNGRLHVENELMELYTDLRTFCSCFPYEFPTRLVVRVIINYIVDQR